jgi:hypothetical protein
MEKMEKGKKVLLFLLFIAILVIAVLIILLVTNDNNCTSIINLKNKQISDKDASISDKDATISDKDATIILQKTQISSKSNVLVGTDTIKREQNSTDKVIFNLPSYFGVDTIDCLVIVSYKNEQTGNVLLNVVRAYYYPGNTAGVSQVFNNMTTQTTIPYIEVSGDSGGGNVYARVLNGDDNSTYKISWTVIRL